MTIGLLLGAGLTVVSASTASGAADLPVSWTCAYVAERLPRSLMLFGDDAASGAETRDARARLSLSDAILTRASNLTLARSLGATRLVVVRCFDQEETITLEAQAFDADRPLSDDPFTVTRPTAELPLAIDDVARRLATNPPESEGLAYRAPSPQALATAGEALVLKSAAERARQLTLAFNADPTSIGLRLSTMGALIASRDFEGAIRLARLPTLPGTPAALVRAVRFKGGAAQLEAGRYAEARDTFEALRRSQETAAVLNNLGVASFRLREEGGFLFFDRAGFLLDHRQEDIAFNEALALLFEGRPDRALVMLDRPVQAARPDVRVRLLRVWALRLLDREPERAEEWERLMQVAPSYASLAQPDLARRLERIFFSERTPAAEAPPPRSGAD